MPISKNKLKRPTPWWLGGEEECPHCHQLYAYEVEVRCPECDGPSCPHCVMQHVEHGIVCVACSDTSEQTEDISRG